MNYGPLLFLGLLCTMWFSWYGFVFKNYKDFGSLPPATLPMGGTYPVGRPNITTAGQEVYQENGCFYCHTMQVRMEGYGADMERGFGPRLTVLRDFLRDENVFLGRVRLGPDLSNAGLRRPNPEWQLQHLYAPRSVVEGSIMPRYEFLFEKQPIRGGPSPNALNLTGEYAPEPGYEIVPTPQAEALAAYLVSLRTDFSIFEAPIPPPSTNNNASAEAPAATNSNNGASAPAPDQQ